LKEMAEQKATNVHWHEHSVSKGERWQLSKHKGAMLWFTGLSASGKSTVANTVDHKLHAQGKRTFVLDGDNIRMGLNKNLGFSAEDRAENIRRIGEVGKLFVSAGVITSTAFISPYRRDRKSASSATRRGFIRKPARGSSRGSPASTIRTKPPKSPSWSSTAENGASMISPTKSSGF
jgi:adenylylsulfate kinase